MNGFKAGRVELMAALESVRHVIDAKNWRPVFRNCRIRGDTARGGLTVMGMDLDTWISARVDGAFFDGIGEGFLLPLHGLLNFLKSCEGEEIAAEYRAGVVGVKARTLAECAEGQEPREAVEEVLPAVVVSTEARETIELLSDDLSEYPAEPPAADEVRAVVGIAGAELARLIDSTLPHAARDVGRYAMHGLMMRAGDTFSIVAVDGRRLAIATAADASVTGTAAEFILSARTAAIVAKILSRNRKVTGTAHLDIDTDFGDVELKGDGAAATKLRELRKAERDVRGYYCRFALPCGVVVTSRRVEGEFPRYLAVCLPMNQQPCRVRVDVAETVRRLKLVSGICGEEARAVSIVVEDWVTVSAQGVGKGKSSAELRSAVMELVPSGGVRVGVDPRYLSELLESAGAETVALGISDTKSPMCLEAPGFLAVVMPITVDID